MNIGFKRIAAYLVDIVIISVVIFVFTNVKEINFQLNDYNKAYNSYSKLYEKQDNLKEKYEKAKDKYEDEKVTKKELNKVKKEYNDAKDKYEKKSKTYTYKLAKYSVFSTSISIVITLLYFGVCQFLLKGQTIGKKILKLRVVKNKEGNLCIFNYLLRCFILNSIWANLILVVGINLLNAGSYYTLNYYVSNVLYIMELVILMTVFMNKDSRGLHDIIAGTKVISINEKLEEKEVEYIKPKKEDK